MRLLAIAATLVCLVLGPIEANAHSHLERAEPVRGSTVPSAPQHVTLTFSENLEPGFSTLEVRNAAGARVDQGKVTVSGSTMSIGLTALPSGTYKVLWRVLSLEDEGHVQLRHRLPVAHAPGSCEGSAGRPSTAPGSACSRCIH